MKQLFFIGLAATAMLASCSNDETVEQAQSKAISFNNAFVNNGTRSVDDPSFTVQELQESGFAVYGFNQNGIIFNGTTVSYTNNAWSYTPLQYWVAGNTYTFGAIAPAFAAGNNVSEVAVEEGATKVGMTVAFTNDGTTDLLHAAPAQIKNVTDSYNTPVSLTFGHQLSKVKFSFENAVGEGYYVKVENVKITNAKQTGKLTIANNVDNAWSEQAGSRELAFGNATEDNAKSTDAAVFENGKTLESYKELLMIPTPAQLNDADVEYTVTFNVSLYQGETLVGTYDRSSVIKGVELKLGYCYDFLAKLTIGNIVSPGTDPQPITFTVTEITDWGTGTTTSDLTVDKIETSGNN